MTDINDILLNSFKHLTDFSHPKRALAGYIPPVPARGKIVVVGAGKAAAAMAQAFEALYDGVLEGAVITRYGYGLPMKGIKVLEAAHPVPDEAGGRAVQELCAVLDKVDVDDVIVCLLSGGGTALLSAPVDGVSFMDLQGLNRSLLRSGADIQEMNIVRKHLNKMLGGGLAVLVPEARMITLAISDVVGDDPSTIASGPSVSDASTLAEAREVIKRYRLDVSDDIDAALNDESNETLKEGDAVFADKSYHLIVTPGQALDAVAGYWQNAGFEVRNLGAEMVGDTNECAAMHVEVIQDILRTRKSGDKPVALISGGETTVTVRGNGAGGPNTQFMLQAALLLEGHSTVYGMACDTDGIDGSADNAGAFITPETLRLAQEQGLDADAYLANNDSYHFFDALGQLVKTGSTYTNVNDYRVFLIFPS